MFTALATKPVARPLAAFRGEVITLEKPDEDYINLARKLRVTVPTVDTSVEKLNNFLYNNNWPVYSLDAVIPYMTKISDRDNPMRSGWGWTALRREDNKYTTVFNGSRQALKTGRGRHYRKAIDWLNSSRVYQLAVPLHALQKVDILTQAGFTPDKGYHYVVSDLNVEAQVVPKPDPFLMVYVGVKEGEDGWTHVPRANRFVIDFWDEPGFGIAEQLK